VVSDNCVQCDSRTCSCGNMNTSEVLYGKELGDKERFGRIGLLLTLLLLVAILF
jgi:hypothetical protein